MCIRDRASVIEKLNRPTLVLAHNKTLAAQLCSEFREFFPENAVEYFISYYDYYQPEAYIAHTDTYIEKDASVNEEIDRLRHSATSALFERRDVIVVSSVSCLYGLGDPIDYKSMVISLRVGQEYPLDSVLKKLTEIRYERNDLDLSLIHICSSMRLSLTGLQVDWMRNTSAPRTVSSRVTEASPSAKWVTMALPMGTPSSLQMVCANWGLELPQKT